ncbi:MAG: MerR family transcriptional regulator [Deltaproteobacteria bacterium]|nr:MerR family transcriptional regulator [Deltaproteobacteria bacterium]
MFTSGIHLLLRVQPEKKFTSSEVSAQLNVPRSTLRYWEKEFADFISTQETSGKHRRYGPREVEILKEIKELLEVKKYTIAGAKRRMSVNRDVGSVEQVLGKAMQELDGGRPLNEVATKLKRKLDL